MSDAPSKQGVAFVAGFEMVLIPAGEFVMGSPPTEAQRDDDEGPQHVVRITRPFYMGKYPMTQGEWQKVMGSNPSYFKGGDRLPVENVSWNDCQDFCHKAENGLRLPTEAEWEYACRAGSSAAFSFGHDDAALGAYAWFYRNSGAKTHNVGEKKPNEWGLYDIHGNVWEWCADRYDKTYYAKSPVEDPIGPTIGTGRVLRGGSWVCAPRYCRSANRRGYLPMYPSEYYGFRVVAPVPE